MLSAGFSMDTFVPAGLRVDNSLFDNICMCGNPHTKPAMKDKKPA